MGELIKLPISLGLKVNQILKEKIGFTPRTSKIGLLSFEFTSEELGLITKLYFENPLSGDLEGIDLLPNLKTLDIKTYRVSAYTRERDIASISDKDGFAISRCKSLENLTIDGQTKLTYLDVSGLENLRGLTMCRNARLSELSGLEELLNLWTISLIGNESLTHIENLDKIILKNKELTDVGLDILLYPDAIGYKRDGSINEEVMKKFTNSEINTSWEEIMSSGKNIKINLYQMMKMHAIACEGLLEYIPPLSDIETIVLGIEQYLAENVRYDYAAIKSKSHTHTSEPFQLNGHEIRIANGPLGGANGAFNAFMFKSCVCEGYTRAMQYLLRLKGIKSHNVHNIAGADTLHMADYEEKDDPHKKYDLPNDGYHSIISIDDLYYLYDDPCWNACRYQRGDRSMEWTLRTKKEISIDHTLSFGERYISNDHLQVPREKIRDIYRRIELYREERRKQKESSENPLL